MTSGGCAYGLGAVGDSACEATFADYRQLVAIPEGPHREEVAFGEDLGVDPGAPRVPGVGVAPALPALPARGYTLRDARGNLTVRWLVWMLGCAAGPELASEPETATSRPEGRAYAVQMHLHGPISEGDTTYAYQHQAAARAGVDVLWWTEHDHMYDRSSWIRSPRWASGGPLIVESPPPQVEASWWELTTEAPLHAHAWLEDLEPDGIPAMWLEASTGPLAPPAGLMGLAGCASGPDVARFRWRARGDQGYNALARPLLADLSLRLALQPGLGWELGEDRVRLGLEMSTLTDGVPRRIWLAEADDPLPSGPLDTVVPIDLAPDTWTEVELDLSGYAEDELPEGLDLALQGLVVELEPAHGEARVALSGIELSESLCCDQLLTRQEKLLAAMEDGEVRHLVGQELSQNSVQHLTAFGLRRFVDYEVHALRRPFELTGWVHEQGGRVAITHVFGPTADIIDPSLEPAAEVSRVCEELTEEGGFRADYLEVGYVERGLPLRDHLAVWDCVLAAGLVHTGLGTSDNHYSRRWESMKNPFVTWVMADEPSEEALLAALDAGRAFFGNPLRARAPWLDLRIEDVGHMGQIVDELAGEALRVEADLSGVPARSQLRWMVDGELVAVGPMEIEALPDEWTVIRAEVWSERGEPLLFSNPIVLSTEDVDVPADRQP